MIRGFFKNRSDSCRGVISARSSGAVKTLKAVRFPLTTEQMREGMGSPGQPWQTCFSFDFLQSEPVAVGLNPAPARLRPHKQHPRLYQALSLQMKTQPKPDRCFLSKTTVMRSVLCYQQPPSRHLFVSNGVVMRSTQQR